MQIRFVLTDEDAVSSVIGVVLMVAVAVILAAAVGAFTLGIAGDTTEKTPSVSMDFDWGTDGGDETVFITMAGGDTLESKNVRVSLGGSVVWNYDQRAGAGSLSIYDGQDWNADEIDADDTLGLKGSMTSGETMRVIWFEGEKSQVLADSDVP